MLNKKKLITRIQKDYFNLTKNRISQRYIEKKILPIFFYINHSRKKYFIFSGSQGVGKSTLTKILEKNFYIFFKKKILRISIDDFYYNSQYRNILSKKIHPLLNTRGVPGTHNINKLTNIITKFRKSSYPIEIPTFDKLEDNTTKKKRRIKKKHDILILEGWCCGSPHIDKKYLYKNINSLEKKYDKNFVWRNFYNNCLKNDYSKLFQKFDEIIYLKTNSFNNVLKWRFKQEKFMSINKKNSIKMNRSEINIFIQHYEKITRWMMIKMPSTANLTINIDKNQKIKKISSA